MKVMIMMILMMIIIIVIMIMMIEIILIIAVVIINSQFNQVIFPLDLPLTSAVLFHTTLKKFRSSR